MIVLTTCRRPTQRIRSFTKDLSNLHPTTRLLTRGKMGLVDLVAVARSLKSDHVAIISRFMGGPGRIDFLKLNPVALLELTLYLKAVKLRREYGTRHSCRPMIVTVPVNMRSDTAKFARWYAELFAVRLSSESSSNTNASIHMSEESNTIRVAVISPSAETVGPSYDISRIDWGPADTAE